MARHAATQAGRKRPDRRGGWRRAVAVVLSVSLAVVLFAAGFLACAAPVATRVLCGLTGAFDTTPYLPAQLVDLAVATRDFTVDAHLQGDQAAAQQLAQQVMDAAIESANPASEKAQWWRYALDWRSARDQRQAEGYDALAQMYELAQAGQQYALSPEAVEHLVDCNRLIRSALPVVGGIAAVALVCLLALRRSRLLLGRALLAAPAVLLAAMLATGAWAALDFNGFFGAFHGVLFPQGNWTFPSDSLLISMLPQGFWMGMGAVWLTVTALACIIAVLCGRRVVSRVRNARPEAQVRRTRA